MSAPRSPSTTAATGKSKPRTSKSSKAQKKRTKKSTKKSAKKATTKKKSKKKAAKKTAKKPTRKKSAQKRPTSRAKGSAAAQLETRRVRAEFVLQGLRELYSDAECALHHENGFQLLIATILSAQSTDANVNKVTPNLFRHYPTPRKLALADPEEVSEIIRSTGFFRQKTKNIIGCARRLWEDFDGEVPQTIAELITLPGVARKTANVVLGTWFGKNLGVVVDTHVGRLATRLDLTWTSKDTKDAVKIEKDLMEVLPQEEWTFFSHAIIWHGRQICSARKPLCVDCLLAPECPSAMA